MLPTYENGDILIIKKWSVPQKGDVITAYIEELDSGVVKRVLATEGDHIKFDKNILFINKEQIMEISDMHFSIDKDFIVPANHFLLIGDNEKESVDSRNFGCVGKSNIQGIVIKKLF